MDVLLAITTVMYLVAVVFCLKSAFQGGDDGPLWEARWLGLDATGRARIATAAHSRAARDALAEPEDPALLAGYRRRRRRRRAKVDLAASPFLIVAAALGLGGVLASSLVIFLFGVAAIPSGLWNYLQERQMDGQLREVVEAEALIAP